MVSSTFFKGVLVLVLTMATSQNALGIAAAPSEPTSSEEPSNLTLASAITQAEADISLRRLKASHLTDGEGVDFIKRVEEIRRRLGGQ